MKKTGFILLCISIVLSVGACGTTAVISESTKPSTDSSGQPPGQALGIELGPNQYIGIGEGGIGGPIIIKVTMNGGKIEAIEVIEQNETEIGASALNLLPKKMIEAQSAEVDNISGATLTSTGLKNALVDALSKVK